MNTKKWGIFFLLMIVCSGGCASAFRNAVDPIPDSRMLYLHGKAGRVTSGLTFWLTLPVDAVFLPITYPVGKEIAEHKSDKGMFVVYCPGMFFQSTVYALGTGVVYPVHLIGEKIPESLHEMCLSPPERNKYLQKKWPFLTKSEYDEFAQISGWTDAPAYQSWRDGILDFLCLFRFGSKPMVAPPIIMDWNRRQEKLNREPEPTQNPRTP